MSRFVHISPTLISGRLTDISELVRKAFRIIRSEGFSIFVMEVLTFVRRRSLSLFRRTLRPLKEFKIKLYQHKLLKENYFPSAKKLIIFLTLGDDIVNGGILSISSIYEETKNLKHIHGADTIMCTIPGDPLLLKYTKFENPNYIFRFSQVMSYFQNLQSLMIHVPEYCIDQFIRNISSRDYLRLNKIKDVHINLMIQNIELLPPLKYIERLKKLGKLTCTTAHEKYSTPELRKKLGFPLHKLSWFTSPEKYNKKRYIEKEDLMIVSPDSHPKKSEVLSLITQQLPQLRIQIISNLTYEEYKKVISRAKWALTFGEGLDGYFVETIFSGGISFSVYNPAFFTEDFKSLRTIYNNYDILIKKICSDIKDLGNEIIYINYQNEQYDLCSRHFEYKDYIKNIELFYKGEYTYL